MRVGLVLAAFAFVVVAMLRTMSARAMDGCLPPAGFMRSIQGQVEIRRAPADWRPAALDEPLCAGDLIRVGDRSRALAAIANLTQRIDQNTTLSLTYVPEDKPAVIGLLEGAVYFFSRKPRILEVDTPFFDAGVEGTEFLVRVEPQRAQLTVFDGKITARNPQGELTVANGESLTAEAGQAPAPYVLVRPRDAVQWALFYPIILLPLADRSGAAAREIMGPLAAAVELAARGEYAAAFAAFKAIPDPDRGAEFYLYRAATLLSVGRVDDARADIDQALARDPAGGRAYALSAVIAVAQNERERAIADGERGVELSPRSAVARIALSYAEQARFRIEAARATMSQAVQDEPENALAWARLSELWLMQGYRGRALKAAKTARKLAPELERTQTVLGFAALAAIDLDKAKQAFGRAIALNSADPQARFGLGLATIRGGALDEGRSEIELAVGLDPDDSLLRSYLGKAYFDSRTTDPEKYLRELFTNFPNQENTLAAEQYAIAKRLDPNDPTPWLYDAIRKQSENRPVEALRDIEKSVELNDNRAVYRSRELLDQDRAARGASLARIYNDLGFEQLGINEATKSLSYDPANAGAHRFLSDVYATQPRREIARVSELLQAQLLQDININPIQPSLSETHLGINLAGGPTRAGFNEFASLFERNQTQLNLSGEVGSDDTRADEAVVSGIYDWLSISAGQFHYQTDGFRRNFDLEHDLFNLFAQAAVAPGFNVQAEFLHRSTEEGDRRLLFGSELFNPLRRRDVDGMMTRAGLRLSPSPQSDILGSLIYNKRDLNLRDTRASTASRAQDAIQGETRYLFRSEGFNFTTGLSIARIGETDQTIAEKNSTYMYANLSWPESIKWTIGLSADYYEEDPLPSSAGKHVSVSRLNPKFGLQWQINDDTRFRFAAFQSVRSNPLINRTIEPTQIAGFNQLFDDINATVSWIYGAGIDARLTDTIYAGLEFTRRDQDQQLRRQKEVIQVDRDEDQYQAYLLWTPGLEWAVRGAVQLEVFDRGSTGVGPTQLDTISLPLGLSYFHPSGFLAGVGTTYVHQHLRQQFGRQPGLGQGDDGFVIVDASVGYRFPERRGLLSLEVRNLFDSDFRYQDDSFRQARDEPSIIPFLPNRTVMARLALNF